MFVFCRFLGLFLTEQILARIGSLHYFHQYQDSHIFNHFHNRSYCLSSICMTHCLSLESVCQILTRKYTNLLLLFESWAWVNAFCWTVPLGTFTKLWIYSAVELRRSITFYIRGPLAKIYISHWQTSHILQTGDWMRMTWQ